MIQPFPHHYSVNLYWKSTNGYVQVPPTVSREATLVSKGAPAIFAGPSPEFGGPEGRWSSEGLLLASIDLCLMNTFFALAERAKLALSVYQSRAQGELNKGQDGISFTSITVEVALGSSEYEQASELLQTAKNECITSLGLKLDIQLSVTPVAAPDTPSVVVSGAVSGAV